MDEIELLVSETFRHFKENFCTETEISTKANLNYEDEIPTRPGLLYHLQKTSTIFVIRSLVSANIQEDYKKILTRPEDYPSLRLLEGDPDLLSDRLRYFIVENPYQADIIHDQLNNRRFPTNEEAMCNLSDPGFSWWLTKKNQGFQLSFTLSVGSGKEKVKLGPLGDQQLALRSFQNLGNLIALSGLNLNIQNEINRVQFTEGEEFLMEELNDLFEFGVVSEGLIDLFKILARQVKDHSSLETSWFYLQELAAMRRFWIQVQYDLNSQC